jgi:hypothetical protein
MKTEGMKRGIGQKPAETARRLVLNQHRELRRLLTMGLAEVQGETAAGGPGHEPLRSLVSVVRDVFLQHLTDEEALIVPILEDDLPVGPQRVMALREEHHRQRSELNALSAWPDEANDLDLASRFAALTKVLLEDIAHEERELLIPEVIRDDHVVVDQSDG